ncbi:hypothetical protein D3C85_1529230 [compost metagenome]
MSLAWPASSWFDRYRVLPVAKPRVMLLPSLLTVMLAGVMPAASSSRLRSPAVVVFT